MSSMARTHPAQKRMHNTQALRGMKKKAGIRTESYSKTPPVPLAPLPLPGW